MGGGLWRGAPKKDEAQGTLWGAVCLWWGYIHTATAAQGLLVGNTLAFLDASSVQFSRSVAQSRPKLCNPWTATRQSDTN